MKKFNFNVNRKTLYLVLGLMIVSVFTLTVVYAALNTVLTISGNARVSAADWDIYLNNPRVTNGSATTDVPQIKSSSTLEFSTTLNMPGDFYEFTVDVVNGGSIDAMIENVVKTPELTTEQAKYLKYEITYQNGESITTKQTLSKGSTMPIKVRIEYRKDLTATDLPTGQVVLDLALTLEYIQSDGTGSSVNNNGVYDPFKIGNEKCFGTECFYVIGTEGDNVKLLSIYNLYIGYQYDDNNGSVALVSPTGMQSELARGWFREYSATNPIIGTTPFSSDTQKGTNYGDYNGSIVEGYVNSYKNALESEFGVDVIEARLITYDELTDPETFACVENDMCSDKYPWIYSISYWFMSDYNTEYASHVSYGGYFDNNGLHDDIGFGVRPVIVVSKDYF